MGIWGSSQTTKTTSDSTSKYTVDKAGWHEQQLRQMSFGAAQGMQDSQGQYAALGGSLIDELFGGMDQFKEMMLNRDVTPEQRAQIEKLTTTSMDIAGGLQSAQQAQARGRMGNVAQDLLQQAKDQQASTGMRGTAGSGRFAQAMSGLGQSMAGMEGQFDAQRGALARQAQGGAAGMMLNMPGMDQQRALMMLQGAGQDRGQQVGVLNAANSARQMLMSNPLSQQFLQERMATGTQTNHSDSTSTTESSMGLGQMIGGWLGSGASGIGMGGGGDGGVAGQGGGGGAGMFNLMSLYGGL